jgi:FMN phosphatase YigB (HAD superfamily)
MAIRKLVSDFDGVWTNQKDEAEYVWNYILTSVSGLTGLSTGEISDVFRKCFQEMSKEPWEYGWFYNGKIAAYYQEDPFGDNNALFDYIDRKSSNSSHSNFRQRIYEIKKAILKKFASLSEFSQYCFVEATTGFRREGRLKPIEKAAEIIKDLNTRGIGVVVVSNSKTDKIQHLFTKAGLKATDEKSFKRGRLHARGGAGKFIIDNSFDQITEQLHITQKIKINLRRPSYYNILKDELPDYVIGDVFSLDLALPLWLILNNEKFRHMKLIQKIQPHTPGWVIDYIVSDEIKKYVHTVNTTDEIKNIIN